MYTRLTTPVGELFAASDGEALTGLYFVTGTHTPATHSLGPQVAATDIPLLQNVKAQLGEYFAGERTEFTIPVRLTGTDFQLAVWGAVQQIPFGHSCSYGDIARLLGNPNAVRGVGQAVGRNPISIIVPCHRVLGASGAITGYAGGIPAKRMLLELEHIPVLETATQTIDAV